MISLASFFESIWMKLRIVLLYYIRLTFYIRWRASLGESIDCKIVENSHRKHRKYQNFLTAIKPNKIKRRSFISFIVADTKPTLGCLTLFLPIRSIEYDLASMESALAAGTFAFCILTFMDCLSHSLIMFWLYLFFPFPHTMEVVQFILLLAWNKNLVQAFLHLHFNF